MSGYVLINLGLKIFTYGLDYHILTLSSYHAVETEFELFYQKILISILYIPENKLVQLKTKLVNVCHKYNNIKVVMTLFVVYLEQYIYIYIYIYI